MTLTNVASPVTFNTNGNNITLSGVLGGSGGLIKTGNGTLILSTAESYSGPTSVNGGTLQVDGSTAAASAVAVNSGGTLAGTGVINGPVTANSGGTVSPGVAAPGDLGTGSLTLNAASLYTAQIYGSTPGDGAGKYDQLAVTGTVNLGGTPGATLDVDFNWAMPATGRL